MFLISSAVPAEDEQEISTKERFQIVGLEESLQGISTYLTTLKCEEPSGEVTDPSMIEMYENLLKI